MRSRATVPGRTRRQIRVIGGIVALAVSFLTTLPMPAWSWSAGDHEEIASDAVRLSPPVIRDFLSAQLDWVKDGASTPARTLRDCHNHGFSPLASGGVGGLGQKSLEWSALPRAMELYRAAVDDLRRPPLDQGSSTARRMGLLAHYVASFVQPPRTAWNCNAADRYVQPIYLGLDSRSIPADVEKELIAAGTWASEIDPERPRLDSLYYATAASLTARIWAAVWQAAGRTEDLREVTDTRFFNLGREILSRPKSLVEYCQDQYNRARGYFVSLVLFNRLQPTLGEMILARANMDNWSKKLDEAMVWQAEHRTPSADELRRQVADLEKGKRQGLEVLEHSVVVRDGKLFINGRFLNHGPTPVAGLRLAVQFFDAKGGVLKQVVDDRLMVSEEPEGYLPDTLHRFRQVMSAKDLPAYQTARVVLIRASSADKKKESERTF